jgi:hypothetical protein
MVKFTIPVLLGLILISQAHASILPGLDWTGGQTDIGYDNQTFVMGYQFQANSAVTVNSLGAYDMGGDGLNTSHLVGIWDLSGNELARTEVLADEASTLIGHFRYSMLSTALQLTEGQSYVVGAFGYGLGGDAYAYAVSGLVQDPGITWENARLSPQACGTSNPLPPGCVESAGGLVNPTYITYNGGASWFGGTVGLAPVPVPAAIWLFGTALIGFLSFSRRTSVS